MLSWGIWAMPGYRVRRVADALTMGPRRRRRSMDRRLAELDRIEFGAVPIPRERRSSSAITFIVVLLAVGGLVTVWLGVGGGKGGAKTVAADTRIGTRFVDVPTHTHLTQPRRLLPAVVVSHLAGAAPYRLFKSSDGRARWEPCRAIHYVVRRAGEGARVDALFRAAVAEVSAATGLRFVDDGRTGELPLADPLSRLAYQPRVYGDRWAPVLIAWSNPTESPRLAGQVEGFAGPYGWGADTEPTRYVSGAVTYDADKLRLLLRQPRGAAMVRAVLLHELGHLVGLAHVHDVREVMYPTLGPDSPSHYAAGDRAGLAYLGSGPCYSDF